jgi:Flp pilus assembly protein TadD
LQETARALVQKGDYDNAVIVLERAKQQEPNNVEILKDLCFANYLKRDFSKAIEVGKELVEKNRC